MERVHQPVMPGEVVECLDPRPGGTYVDMTLGAGGHAQLILRRLDGRGTLLGIDRDGEILELARKNLAPFADLCQFRRSRFSRIGVLLRELAIERVDGALYDLGVSSYQLQQSRRGFSFQAEGPLDMRMDSEEQLTAEEIVNTYSEKQLADLFYHYGEETRSRRFAREIVAARSRKPIRSTLELARLIEGIAKRGRIHPATKVFQALRIETNQELKELKSSLEELAPYLAPAGRIVVISFHSLEDRIVKRFFKAQQQSGVLEIITAKPIYPSPEEVRTNPKSRSAKLRCARRPQ